jgi:heme/copper-type cytochrome/quinol oxidase subunit 3
MTAVTAGHPLPHHESVDTVGRRWRTGVVLLMVADVAFVASLVFTYFYLRGLNTQGAWFPKGASVAPIWVGWAIAAALVASAATYRWGEIGMRAGNDSRLIAGAGVAVLLVLADAVAQVAQLVTFSFGLADGSYASSVYVLAGANLFHLLFTLFLGVGLWNRARLHKYSVDNDWQVRIIGIWWSWIAVASVIGAITTSFVASPNHLTGG